jgi:hypothetical protein
MNPTQAQDSNTNVTIDQNESHMISVKPVVNKVSKLKVFTYILLIIIIAAITAGVFYIFQNPASIIKKSLAKFDDVKVYQIDTDMVYSDSKDASSTMKLNLLTKVDVSSLDKYLLSINADLNIMNEDIKLESRIIGSDFYININKASIIEMFFGKDLINKWIYISKKDIENNPFGVKVSTTTTDNVKDITASDKGLDIIDNGIVIFADSKIQFENGKIIRKNYFNIDKDKLAEYIDADIKKMSPDGNNDSFGSMKDSFDKTEINEAYIITDFLDNSFKSAYINFAFKATSSVQTMEISLKYDDMTKGGLTQLIEAPKDFTSLESIFKTFMDRNVKQ